MINFKKALLGIGIVLAIGSASALWAIAPSTVSQVVARDIPIPGRTNDGSILHSSTMAEPVYAHGWTIFQYQIEKKGSELEPIAAITPYCTQGKVVKNPNLDAGYKLPIPDWASAVDVKFIQNFGQSGKTELNSPGWVANVNGRYVVVVTDSSASKEMLARVCRLAL